MFVKTRSSRNKVRGIGLLELMLSLAIIAILLVMATRYYVSAKQSQQVGDAVSMFAGIFSGGANYHTGNNHTYKDISLFKLVNGGYVPLSFCGGTGADAANCPGSNPWKGTIQVTGAADGSHYTVVMDKIPTNGICNSVSNMVDTSLRQAGTGGTNISKAECEGTTVTATIY